MTSTVMPNLDERAAPLQRQEKLSFQYSTYDTNCELKYGSLKIFLDSSWWAKDLEKCTKSGRHSSD
jgi:hypothetical protein